MKRKFRNFILAAIVVYIGLNFVSVRIASAVLIIFLILLVPMLLLRQLFLDASYKNSIKIVAPRFVLNQYTLSNDYCIVEYVPDEKITVTDNVSISKRKEVRTFTIVNSKKLNINKSWNKICKIYDSFISLDELASYLGYDTKVDVVMIKSDNIAKTEPEPTIKKDKPEQKPALVDINDIQPDTYVQTGDRLKKTDEKFVDMEKIQKAGKVVEREIKNPEFVEMDEVLSSVSRTIDVNNATAGEIAILPGIDITMAKNIVEYRDKNGLFKNFDDFIGCSGVEEDFVEKIRRLIVIGEPVQKNDDDEDTI